MNANILIVDDDPGAIQCLHNALLGLGRVRYATGGRDALAMLGDDGCDLVLLDANMPDLDGFATCRLIRQEYPEIPVLFVTADTDFGTEVRALETGARDFISKPINPPVVRARVTLHLRLKEMYDQLHDLNSRDPLTGLANRRALDERMALEWRRAARHGLPLGLLMIDVDQFKRYNDHYGHVRGDDCLCGLARALEETTGRAGDLVARYGGEEFAVLLPGSRLEPALALAGKIRAAVHALAIPHAHSDTAPHVTLSIGAASLLPVARRQDPQSVRAAAGTIMESGLCLARDLIDRADRALYAAKAAGRDRVCAAAWNS